MVFDLSRFFLDTGITCAVGSRYQIACALGWLATNVPPCPGAVTWPMALEAAKNKDNNSSGGCLMGVRRDRGHKITRLPCLGPHDFRKHPPVGMLSYAPRSTRACGIRECRTSANDRGRGGRNGQDGVKLYRCGQLLSGVELEWGGLGHEKRRDGWWGICGGHGPTIIACGRHGLVAEQGSVGIRSGRHPHAPGSSRASGCCNGSVGVD